MSHSGKDTLHSMWGAECFISYTERIRPMRKDRLLGNKNINNRGFTLTELCVVMALIAIVGVMIATFSTAMSSYTKNINEQYAFSEDCARFTEDVKDWVYTVDMPESCFDVNGQQMLTVTNPANPAAAGTISFSDGRLTFDGASIGEYKHISEVRFEKNSRIIKCTLVSIDERHETHGSTFVFSPRCGTVGEGGG